MRTATWAVSRLGFILVHWFHHSYVSLECFPILLLLSLHRSLPVKSLVLGKLKDDAGLSFAA